MAIEALKGGVYAPFLANSVVGIGGTGNDRQWSDNFHIGLAQDPAVEVLAFRSIARAPGGASVTRTFDSRAGRNYAVDYSTERNALSEIADAAAQGGGAGEPATLLSQSVMRSFNSFMKAEKSKS